jgi:molecular chaperone DnaJ
MMSQGKPVHKSVTISLQESYYGCSKEIDVDEFTECSSCNGNGGELQTCQYCHGNGVRIQQNGFMTIQTTCDKCGGAGKIISKRCSVCNGTGYNSKKSKITINIPKGIDNGISLRISGKGYPGKNGGQSGDLIVTINIKEELTLKRINDDLLYTYNIKLSDILCGSTKSIDIFSEKIKFTIDKLYDISKPIIIENKGFKSIRGNHYGNLIICLNLMLPNKELSEDTKNKLVELEKEIY